MLKFNWLDKFIRYLRLRQISPFIGKDRIVCDLGCGDGSTLRQLKSKIKSGYGADREVDSSREENLRFIKADLTQPLSLRDGEFDIVLLLAVIEHLESPDLILGEIWRILKPGGRLILTTPAPRSKKLLEFLAFRLEIISGEGVLDHKHYYSGQELINLLRKFNFRILKLKLFEFGLNQIVVAEKTF